MNRLLNRIEIVVTESLYNKNPMTSDLGKSILLESCKLIDEIGFESFTFKKLASILNTAESSVYRYFENKHNLLMYLMNWYWGYIEYIIVFSCANINNSKEKISTFIDVLTEAEKNDPKNGYIDYKSLNNIIICESAKTYLTKNVNKDNEHGFFTAFKRPNHFLSEIICEANSNYPYPNSLASTVVEGILSQKFFSIYLKSLTNFSDKDKKMNDFYKNLVFKTIEL